MPPERTACEMWYLWCCGAKALLQKTSGESHQYENSCLSPLWKVLHTERQFTETCDVRTQVVRYRRLRPLANLAIRLLVLNLAILFFQFR